MSAKIGILSGPPSLEDVRWLAVRAEAAGFDSVWAGEYFSRNVFTNLAAMALSTRRIMIGSAICYAFIRSPTQLAMASADVDEISGGRLLLGLGPGTRAQNEDWYGVPFEHPGPKLKEVVAIARGLWGHTGGPFRFEGRFHKLSIPNFVRHNQARPQVPVYVGATNPYMLGVVGQIGDGLLGHPSYTRGYYREVVLPALQEGIRKAGRQPGDVQRALLVVTVVDRDEERARREAARWLSFYLVARPFHSILDHHGWQEEKAAIVDAFRPPDQAKLTAAISERMWREVLALVGTPDQVRRQWQELSPLADHVILLAPAPYGGLDFPDYRKNYELILETFGR